MRKSCFNLFALLLTLLVSCSKEDNWAEYYNENYAGHYKLESATFAPDFIYPESEPIDFDGSGRKTNDIIDGLGMDSRDLSQTDVWITECSDRISVSGDVYCLSFLVPAQRIEGNGDKMTIMKSPGYVLCPVNFYYSIDKDGRIKFYENGDLTGLLSAHEWIGDVERNPQLLHSGKAKMVKCENGEIVFSVGLCYVDCTDYSYRTEESYFTFKRQ